MRLHITAICLVVAAAWAAPSAAAQRQYNAEELAAGEKLYQNSCASCHGNNGEGMTRDWQQRDANGNFPPPPLNGTAHTWHHPVKGLHRTIKDGTIAIGGTMPAWGETLSDDEILLIINWITSLWSDDIYEMWNQRN